MGRMLMRGVHLFAFEAYKGRSCTFSCICADTPIYSIDVQFPDNKRKKAPLAFDEANSPTYKTVFMDLEQTDYDAWQKGH